MAQGPAAGRAHVDNPVAAGEGELARGREAVRSRDWAAAYEALRRADETTPLEGDDLQQLAMASYLLGHRDEAVNGLQRSHQYYVDNDDRQAAARCAFWLAFLLLGEGEVAQGSGWLAQANRHLSHVSGECAEHGYVLLPIAIQNVESGDYVAGREIAARAADIGARVGSPDVTALALHAQGRALLREGHASDGLALLDEAMVFVLTGRLTPVVSGVIYCSVLEACQEIAEVHRAREWTDALSSWCDAQHDMVMFTGNCLVHRAEITHLRGAWSDAAEQAREACDRFAAASDRWATGAAMYRLGEIFRTQGNLAAAETAYEQASEWGHEPQPGLALLRLAQGQADVAVASVRRLTAETAEHSDRVKLLPAVVEIALAHGDRQWAQEAATELAELADRFGTHALKASARFAAGAVLLDDGDAQAALPLLRESWRLWSELDAPYEAARVRSRIGVACRELGDEEGALLEFAAARRVLKQLGARPDVAHVDELMRIPRPATTHGLTDRELQVLRLVASGKTNRTVARELFLAQRTVDRHVSNIFAKLGVSSRSEATAYAHRHDLV